MTKWNLRGEENLEIVTVTVLGMLRELVGVNPHSIYVNFQLITIFRVNRIRTMITIIFVINGRLTSYSKGVANPVKMRLRFLMFFHVLIVNGIRLGIRNLT